MSGDRDGDGFFACLEREVWVVILVGDSFGQVVEKGSDVFEILEDEALLKISGGDARKLLSALELVINSTTEPVKIDNALVQKKVQTKSK